MVSKDIDEYMNYYFYDKCPKDYERIFIREYTSEKTYR